MNRKVVLVNDKDEEIGLEDIFVAHQGIGRKHRALSVILYRKNDRKVEFLLQKRAMAKPVFRGLWSNTACTNMGLGDTYLERAVSRLDDEMGIKIEKRDLKILYRFSYEALDENRSGWCENELDTVIVGEWDGEVKINPEEAEDYKWVEWGAMKRDIERNSDEYAPWWKMILIDKRFIEGVA